MKKAITYIILIILVLTAITATSAHSYYPFPNGDVNLDKKLSISDATLIQKSLAEIITLDDMQILLADYNLDGIINIRDVTKIQIVLAGIEDPPTEIPSSTSPEDEHLTPTEVSSSTSPEDEHLTPTEVPSSTSPEDEYVTPTEVPSSTPPEDEDVTPTEIPSSTPPEDEYVTPSEFGVPADANDDLRLFQKALDAAAEKGVPLNLEGKTYHIYTSESKCPIINGSLKIMPNSSLILTGNNASLKNVNVSRWWKGDGYNYGDVRLHLTEGCVIENCNFSAYTSTPRIFCNTAANNTVIKNCTFSEGFGILFNDGEPETRKYNDILYTDSIGKGLIVDNCIFNANDKPVQYEGDNIEINTPNCRFSDVQVTNCISYGAKINTNVGIGFGFAQVDHIICSDNELYNIEGSGAIHMEGCTDVESNNNIVKNSQYGIMCIYNKNASYSGNTIENCIHGIYCCSSYLYGHNEDVCFSYNNILNCAPHPLLGSGLKNAKIINNTFESDFDHINTIIKLAYDKSYETNNVTVANNKINYIGSFSNKNWAYIIGTDCNIYDNTITGLNPSNYLCSEYLAVRVNLNLPQNTPMTDTMRFVSELNGWNPADASYSFTRTSETTAEIIIDIPRDITHNIDFKITRGSWEKAEVNEHGQENVGEQGDQNHTLNIYGDYGSGYCSFDIKGWKDLNK